FELNAAPSCGAVVARGWDQARARPLEARAEAPRRGRVATAGATLAGAGGAGGAGDAGGAGERLIGGVTGAGEAHAQRIAQAELDRAAASELTQRGTAQGDPALRPGAAVEIAGVADR